MHFISFTVLTLLQVVCIAYAFKRDYSPRYILGFVMFPLIGPVVFFILELLPSIKKGWILRGNSKWIPLKKKPDLLLEYLARAHAIPSFENKYKVALLLIERNRKEEALVQLKELQSGIYEKCPLLLKTIAKVESLPKLL